MIARAWNRFWDWVFEVNVPPFTCYRCGDAPAAWQTNLCVRCYHALICDVMHDDDSRREA